MAAVLRLPRLSGILSLGQRATAASRSFTRAPAHPLRSFTRSLTVAMAAKASGTVKW